MAFNKRGNFVLDLILVIVILIALAMVAVISFGVYKDINSELQTDSDVTDEVKAQLQTGEDNFPSLMDNLFILALVLLWVFLLVSSFFLETHPLFFVFAFIMVGFVLTIGASLSNLYSEFILEDDISADASSFPMANYVIENLLIFIIAISATVGIALYAKSQIT